MAFEPPRPDVRGAAVGDLGGLSPVLRRTFSTDAPELSRSQNQDRMTGLPFTKNEDKPSTNSERRNRIGRPSRGGLFIFSSWVNLLLIAARRSRSCATLQRRFSPRKSKRSRRHRSMRPSSPPAAIRTPAIYKFSRATCSIFLRGAWLRTRFACSRSRWKIFIRSHRGISWSDRPRWRNCNRPVTGQKKL